MLYSAFTYCDLVFIMFAFSQSPILWLIGLFPTYLQQDLSQGQDSSPDSALPIT